MITASSQAALGNSTFYINGFDGNAWYSPGLGLTVTSAPIQVSTSVLYSGASSSSHQATTAKVMATVAGGVPPFSYNWSIAGGSLSYGQANSNAIPAYSLSATSANTVTLTITDSSSSPQSSTLSVPVAAGPVLSEALLHRAVPAQAANVNNLAAAV